MATLPKTAEWVDEIDGVNIGDPVAGGESGPVNLRLAPLAKRTEWLKVRLVEAMAEITALENLVGGISVSDALLKGKNLADVPNKATARANLGVATADHAHDAVYLKIAESLADVPDPAAALDAIGAAAKAHTHEQYCPFFVGEYKLMAHTATADGWVKTNGALYNIAKYPKAFAIFGTKHGGDGITTFAVPDWRGDAIRVNDDGRGIDSGRVLGSEQEDAVQNITGSLRIRRDAEGVVEQRGALAKSATSSLDGTAFSHSSGSTGRSSYIEFDASLVARTADETRMRNRSCCMWLYIGRPGVDA